MKMAKEKEPLVLSTTHYAKAVAWTKVDTHGARGWEVTWPDDRTGRPRMQVFRKTEASLRKSWEENLKTVEIIIPRQFL